MRAVNALGASLDTMLDVSRLDAGVITPVLRPVQLDALFLPLNHTFSARAEHKATAAARARQRPVGAQRPAAAAPHAVQPDGQRAQVHRARRRDRDGARPGRRGVDRGARQRHRHCARAVGRIFEEFYQVNNPGRDRSRGLGIGLSIVQRLSRLLGHPVQMHSRPGRGTHFRVVLPAAGAQANARPCGAFGRRGPPPFATPRRHCPARAAARRRAGNPRGHDGPAAFPCHRRPRRGRRGRRRGTAARRGEGRPFDLLLCDYRLADGADGLDAGLRLSQRGDDGRRPRRCCSSPARPRPTGCSACASRACRCCSSRWWPSRCCGDGRPCRHRRHRRRRRAALTRNPGHGAAEFVGINSKTRRWRTRGNS
jgi:hypothetical protein